VRLAARRRLRTRLRDLAAASAYATVGLSGAVPAWVTGAFGLAFGLSLAQRRPLANHRGWSAALLLVLALGLFGLAFRGALDLVLAAVCFAALVTAHRLVSEPDPATNQQALLGSLLLVAGGAALTGELWFAGCLLGFGVFGCLHLSLAAMEGPVEQDEDLPVRPVLRQVSLGVAVAVLGAVSFFALFPRLSWNVAQRRSAAGVLGATTGMSDRVRLGGGGGLKTSARSVLRASLDPDPMVARLDRYWVGRHFDTFDGREWTGTGQARAPEQLVRLGWSSSRPQWQRIELLPAYGSRTLVGLEQPAVLGPAQGMALGGAISAPLVEVVGEEVHFAVDTPAYTYAVSSVEVLTATLGDEDRRRLTQLPAVDPRVRALARQVTEGLTSPEAIARRLERWLKERYDYSLELEGEVADPVAAFLLERRSGHCEHFATALAVMLRALGIPARVTVGFFGGERVGDHYLVRAGDAHAWVEAWLGTDRWTTLDATPEAGRGGQPTPVLALLSSALDELEELWRSKVVDYTLLDQLTFMRSLVRPPADAAAEGSGAPRRVVLRLPQRRTVVVGAGLLVVALGVAGLLRRGRRRVHPATTFLLELEQRLRQAAVPRREAEDLEALARRLETSRHPLRSPVSRAVRRYLEARFGGRPLEDGEPARLLRAITPPRSS
jgi:protein-glutamine gamma-glutamyltransferase